MKLSKDQKKVIDTVIDFMADDTRRAMVISGAAGTGKTTVTKAMLQTIRDSAAFQNLMLGNPEKEFVINLTCTTNKAVTVLGNLTGEPVQTIHKLLGLTVYNDYKTGKTKISRGKQCKIIKNSLIILDEAGMGSKELLEHISDLTHNCKIIFIGDSYQVAPVYEACSKVFSLQVTKAKLKKIHRQAKGSAIIDEAEKYKIAIDGGILEKPSTHGDTVLYVDSDEFMRRVYLAYDAPHGANTCKILAWTNERVHTFNAHIKKRLTNSEELCVGEYVSLNSSLPDLKNLAGLNIPTDSILQINTIGALREFMDISGHPITFHGVQGTAFQAENQREVTAAERAFKRDKDWPSFFKAKDNFADLRPMHACTINKAQGSTYETVFIDLTDIGKCTLNNDIFRMMYTAITRASVQVVMTGILPDRIYGNR